jgi:MFS transporter, ACS family, hexuronate transporter
MFSYLWGGETCNCPAEVKLIAEWFPAEERSLASGIFNSGAAIGAILALPLLAWIAPRGAERHF